MQPILTLLGILVSISGWVSFFWLFSRSKPVLKIKIKSIKQNQEKKRFILDAVVYNVGQKTAYNCEGGHIIFDNEFNDEEAEGGAFWKEINDTDYDFIEKENRIIDIKPKEMRRCWVDHDISTKEHIEGDIRITFFPWGKKKNSYFYFVFLCFYGENFCFDYLKGCVKEEIKMEDSYSEVFDKIEWIWFRRKLSDSIRKLFLRAKIKRMDFREYVRPI